MCANDCRKMPQEIHIFRQGSILTLEGILFSHIISIIFHNILLFFFFFFMLNTIFVNHVPQSPSSAEVYQTDFSSFHLRLEFCIHLCLSPHACQYSGTLLLTGARSMSSCITLTVYTVSFHNHQTVHVCVCVKATASF